jgi:hypothetical protein
MRWILAPRRGHLRRRRQRIADRRHRRVRAGKPTITCDRVPLRPRRHQGQSPRGKRQHVMDTARHDPRVRQARRSRRHPPRTDRQAPTARAELVKRRHHQAHVHPNNFKSAIGLLVPGRVVGGLGEVLAESRGQTGGSDRRSSTRGAEDLDREDERVTLLDSSARLTVGVAVGRGHCDSDR